MIYFAIVEKDTGSSYGVSFPDLPGCFSAADSEDEIVPNAQEALSLFVDDLSALPPARTIDDLREDSEVRASLSDGAFLLAVPLVVADRKVRANVMIDRSLLATIDREAKSSGMNRSEYMSLASREKLKASGAVLVQRNAASGRFATTTGSGAQKPHTVSASTTSTQGKEGRSVGKSPKGDDKRSTSKKQ